MNRRVGSLEINKLESGTLVKISDVVNEERHVSLEGLVDMAIICALGEVDNDGELSPVFVVVMGRKMVRRLENRS